MRADRERGAVTAETAMALPLLAVFTVSMAWLVSLGITQVRAWTPHARRPGPRPGRREPVRRWPWDAGWLRPGRAS